MEWVSGPVCWSGLQVATPLLLSLSYRTRGKALKIDGQALKLFAVDAEEAEAALATLNDARSQLESLL